MREEIEQVLAEIRPVMQRDGGDIEFVDHDEANGRVRVRMHGACDGCPMALITLKCVVEAALQERIPSIREVEIV